MKAALLILAAIALLMFIGCNTGNSSTVPTIPNNNTQPTIIEVAVDLDPARRVDSGSAIVKEVGKVFVYWIVDDVVRFATATLFETLKGLEANVIVPLNQDSNITIMVELNDQQGNIDEEGIAWLGGLCYIKAGQNNIAEVGPPGTKSYCAYLYGCSLIEDGELNNFVEVDIEDLNRFIEETVDEYLVDVDPAGLFQMGCDFLGGIWEEFISQFARGYDASMRYLENVLSGYKP